MELPIVYQDQSVVAIHKPSGLLVHRTPLAPPSEPVAMQMLRDQIRQSVYPVHRLDRATSGILVFALDADAARALGKQFEQGQVQKKYLAVVRGVPATEWSCDHPLLEIDETHRLRGTENFQSATTHFRRLAMHEFAVTVDKYPMARYSLIEAQPITGRRHQIRRHLKHGDHPIVGDVNYGKGTHNRFFRETFGIQRLLLACIQMDFISPETGRAVSVRTPLQADFAELLNRMNWTDALPPDPTTIS